MRRKILVVVVCLVFASVGGNVLLYRQMSQVCAAAGAFTMEAGAVTVASRELTGGIDGFGRSVEMLQGAASPIGVATDEVAAILEGVIIPEAIKRSLLSEVDRIREGSASVERASRAAVQVTNGMSRSVREIDDGVAAAGEALDVGWLGRCRG